jgi:hypothetical protein
MGMWLCCERCRCALAIDEAHSSSVEVVPGGFVVQTKRWVV